MVVQAHNPTRAASHRPGTVLVPAGKQPIPPGQGQTSWQGNSNPITGRNNKMPSQIPTLPTQAATRATTAVTGRR
jgi:hypothetical protein